MRSISSVRAATLAALFSCVLASAACKDKAEAGPSAASASASAMALASASASTSAAASAPAVASASPSASPSAADSAASAKPPPPDCCKDLKVGQVYKFFLFSGMIEDRTITQVTPTEVSFHAKTVAGKDVIREVDDKWNLGQRADMGIVKPGATHKEVGLETITVSGKKWECHVFEGDDGPAHYKEWRSTKFPFTIRLSVDNERTLDFIGVK